MESKFLYFAYLLGILVLYYGFLGFAKVSNKVFSSFVYQQYKKTYRGYPLSALTGVISNLLLCRFQTGQAYVQGAFYLGQMSWRKSMGLLMGMGIATGAYYALIAFILPMQWMTTSVLVSIFGFFALFAFRSDLYRVHGQRLFYFGILLLGFSWINYIHQYWVGDLSVSMFFTWVNHNILLIFIASLLVSVFLQTSFITGLLALSALHFDLITFEAGLSIFLGGYVGSPIGTLLVYHHVKTKGIVMQVVYCASRFFITGLSMLWIGPLSQSVVVMGFSPTQLLVVIYLMIQILLFLLYWALHHYVDQSIEELIQESNDQPSMLHRMFANMPGICFEVVMVQVLEMSSKVKQMMEIMCQPFVDQSRDAMIQVDECHDQIEQMARKINFYLSKMNLEELDYLESQKETHWFQVSHALKNIASLINRNIMEIASQKKERNLEYKEGSWEAVDRCHALLLENFDRMSSNLQEEDSDRLKAILRNQKQILSLLDEIKLGYLQDVRQDDQLSLEAASNYFSLLGQFQFLGISISRLAYPTIDRRKNNR